MDTEAGWDYDCPQYVDFSTTDSLLSDDKLESYFGKSPQNQNQNCLLVIRPRTIIHQDLCLGKLVPSPHKRSKLSN